MVSKKKKIFILVGMIALLVVTGVLNIYLNANANKEVGGGATGGELGSIFDTVRADRAATRQETLLVLNAIIESEFSTETEKAEAVAQQLNLTSAMDLELVLESFIKTLGYPDVIVTASTAYVTVIVKAEELDDIEVAKILSVVLTEAPNKTASNVRVQNV